MVLKKIHIYMTWIKFEVELGYFSVPFKLGKISTIAVNDWPCVVYIVVSGKWACEKKIKIV